MLWNCIIGMYITDLGETCKGSGARNPDSIGVMNYRNPLETPKLRKGFCPHTKTPAVATHEPPTTYIQTKRCSNLEKEKSPHLVLQRSNAARPTGKGEPINPQEHRHLNHELVVPLLLRHHRRSGPLPRAPSGGGPHGSPPRAGVRRQRCRRPHPRPRQRSSPR